ncbi:hypothetical protein BSKO_07485 [Bryopsis sp. KO-2023]|nr:hypothetical protein BSKO_07485 [Bryopsis sp. KO-2023]
MGESVELFRTRLSYECLGDHVEEVRFDQPVGINALYVGNACTGGPGKALLRAYARDLHGPSGGRFVPLCAATVPCPEDGFNMVETEDLVTDCMILRGRYERVDIRVRGFCLSEPPVEESEDPCDEVLALQPLDFPRIAPPEKHPNHLRVNDPRLVYMDGFPGPVQDALWALVGFGHAEMKGRAIDMEPPEDSVREIRAAADMLCRALGESFTDCHAGEKLEHVATSSSGPSEYMDGFHAEIAELSVRWCELLAILGDRRNALDLNKGMTGLALAVVLCCYRETAVHFLAKGGVKALAAAFHVRGATALMVRYLSCACEMITLATGPLGCAALLGWWCLPDNPSPSQNADRPANEEETDVIHVPGILQVKVKRKEGQDAGGKEAPDGPPPPLASDDTSLKPGSLPPGMVNAKPQSSRISPHSDPAKTGKHSTEENLAGSKSWKSRKDSERRKGKRKNSCDRDEDFGEGEGGYEWTDDNHAGKEADRHGEKEQGSRDMKDGQEHKPRRSSRDAKERNRDERKDRKKHKSHHRDTENQSRRDGERKRREDDSGGGRDSRRHDKQGDDTNQSKQKKHRHDEKRKDRRGAEEDGGGNDGKDLDGKSRGRERGAGGKSEHSHEKERKRHRHKGKGRSRGREKEEKESRSRGEKKDRGRSKEKKAMSKADVDLGSSKEGHGFANLDNGGACETNTEAFSNSMEKPRRIKRPRSVDREERGVEGTMSDQAVDVEMAPEELDRESGPLVLTEGGVNLYDTLVDVLMQPRPESTIACTSRVLQKLNAYEDMVKFHEATVSACQKAHDQCEDEVISHLQQASDALVGISVAIQSLSNGRARPKGQVAAGGKEGKQAPSQGSIRCPDLEVDACVRECLSAGHLLSTIVTLLHVPEMLPTSSKQAAIGQTFNEGLHSIMVTLVSSPSGLFFLRHHARDVLDMVSNVVEKNSGVDKMDKQGWNVVEEVICLVGHVVRASEAVDVVLDSSITSVNAARAVSTLTEMLQGDITQEAAVLSMSLSGNCVHRLLKLMRSRAAFLKNIQQQPQLSSNHDSKSNNRTTSPSLAAETDEACEEGYPPSPNALPVLKLLVELGRSPQAWGMARFCEVADVVVGVMEAERKLWESGCEEGVLELLGRARVAVVFKEKGCGGLMEKLAEVLPQFSGMENKKLVVKDIDSKAAIQLLKSPEEMGVVLMSLNLVAHEFGIYDPGANLSVVYGPGAMPTLEKALRCAIEGFLATRADLQWMLLAGDFRGDLSVGATTRRAVMLMQSITQVLNAWSARLQKGLVEVNGTGFVDALVKAHSLLTVTSESFGAMSGKGTRSCVVLKARHSIACVLSRWVEMEWGPDIIPASFPGPSSEVGPQDMLCTICLLGDLFPTEWPPAKNPLSGSKSFPPPSNIKMRATLARSLEPCASQFRHLIEFALGSENLLVRCAVVRMCARAAGLGGGMGCFLAEPFIEEIVRLTRRDIALCTDQWRIAEYLLALCVWPAMKAALLDLKAASCVSRLIQCIAPQCREDSGAVLMCNVLLQVLGVLCDPDVCLNSLTTLSERLRSDLPSLAETAVMVPALLSSVKHLQGCRGAIFDLLTSVSHSPAGKLGIIKGISKWHSTSGTTSNSTSQSGGENSRACIMWAASQIRECQEGQEADASVSKIATFLDELEDPGENAAKSEPVLTAPNRFKNAVQAAVQFAASSSGDSGVGFGKAAAELPDVHPLALVYDASTQHYWRYAKSQEALKALRRAWVKWPGESPDLGPATSFYGKGLVGASRPRQVQRGVYVSKPGGQERSGIGVSPRGSPIEDMNVEVPVLRRGNEQQSVNAQPPPPQQQHHLHQGPPLQRPAGDLPPVFAPPRRGTEGRRIRMGLGSSRAPSIHVDAFQRRDGSSDLGGIEGPESANGSQEMVKGIEMRDTSMDRPNLALGGPIAERPMPHHPEAPSQKHDFGIPQQQQEKHDMRKSAPEAPKQKQPFTISLPPRARREPLLTHAKPIGRDPRTGVYHPVNRLPTHQDNLRNDGKLRGPVAVVHSDGSGPSSLVRPSDPFHRRVSNTSTVPMRNDPGAGLVRNLNVVHPMRAAPHGAIPKKAGEANGAPLMGGMGRVEGAGGLVKQETSPQAPQLSPETSGPESAVDRELFPSGGTSVGPSSPNVPLAAGSPDASNITKDNVRSLLHNPSTMREILKNHPQLVAALQAKLGQSKSDSTP